MTELQAQDEAMHTRRLFVAWQHPETRSIEPVALLTQTGRDKSPSQYYFSYLKRALDLDAFEPFTAFPDMGRLYSSLKLFPFFANRSMSRKRSDYGRTLELLDLSVDAEPFEVLGRSGGQRATDSLEVFPEPERDPVTGLGRCLFFVRGIRYFPTFEDALEELAVGDRLRMLVDIQNPKNSDAVLLAKQDLRTLGYVPDYLVPHVYTALQNCGAGDVRVEVEHLNGPGTPRHMRMLCRLTTCWPPAYRPFSQPEYQAVVEAPTPAVALTSAAS